MSAAAKPRKRVREPRRVVTFVRPQFMVHEARALAEHVGTTLDAQFEGGALLAPDVSAALEELRRVLALQDTGK
ncbi:MAG TPA: hypothetical protein VK595_00640 [Vicinamibacterales bacterium]|nr:hypothetical protein [Vicinamibacterales bacterium]